MHLRKGSFSSAPAAPWGMAYNARMPAAARESTQSAPAPPSLYETDLYSWTREQAAALRRRDAAAIDWDNVTEEIESLGRSEVKAWTSTAAQAIRNMLKIQYWPSATEAAVSGWMKEVWTFRRAMADTITENPGLQARYAKLLEKAWRTGRDAVVDDLVVDGARGQGTARRKSLRREWQSRIPQQCPWSLEEIVAYDPKPQYRRGRRRELRPDPELWPAPVAQRLREVRREERPAPRPRPRRWSR